MPFSSIALFCASCLPFSALTIFRLVGKAEDEAALGVAAAMLRCARGYDELVREIAGLASGVRLGGHACRCNSDLLSSDSASAR